MATRRRPKVWVKRAPSAASVSAPPASHLPTATSVSPSNSSSTSTIHTVSSPPTPIVSVKVRRTNAR